eukprot:2358343-Rhodomonas_salina.1
MVSGIASKTSLAVHGQFRTSRPQKRSTRERPSLPASRFSPKKDRLDQLSTNTLFPHPPLCSFFLRESVCSMRRAPSLQLRIPCFPFGGAELLNPSSPQTAKRNPSTWRAQDTQRGKHPVPLSEGSVPQVCARERRPLSCQNPGSPRGGQPSLLSRSHDLAVFSDITLVQHRNTPACVLCRVSTPMPWRCGSVCYVRTPTFIVTAEGEYSRCWPPPDAGAEEEREASCGAEADAEESWRRGRGRGKFG